MVSTALATTALPVMLAVRIPTPMETKAGVMPPATLSRSCFSEFFDMWRFCRQDDVPGSRLLRMDRDLRQARRRNLEILDEDAGRIGSEFPAKLLVFPATFNYPRSRS
jgi:hypothetical protein